MQPRVVMLTLAAALAAAPLLAAAPQDANAPRSEEVIIETAVLRPVRSTTIVNSVAGRSAIRSIVEEGTRVAEGDLLCVIDTTATERQVDALTMKAERTKAELLQIEAQLDGSRRAAAAATSVRIAQLSLAKLALVAWKEGEFPLRVAELEGDVTIAEAEIERAKAVTEEATSRLERLDAAVDLTRAETARRLATMKLKHLKEYEHLRRLTELEQQIEVLSAENRSQDAEAQTRSESLAAAMDSGKAELEQLMQQIDIARTRVNDGQILAPHAGTVLHVSGAGRRVTPGHLQPGAEVRERQPLLEIHDLSRFLAIAHVKPAVAAHLAPGESVEVIVDALPDRVFAATTSAVIQQDEKPDDVEVWLQMDPTDDQILRPGMTAIVKIPVD